MSKALGTKKHTHPCPTCTKPVTCWWKKHGPEQLGMGTCDECLRIEMEAWEGLKVYYQHEYL